MPLESLVLLLLPLLVSQVRLVLQVYQVLFVSQVSQVLLLLIASLVQLLLHAFLMQLLVYGCGICGSARHALSRTFWDNKGIESGQQDLPPGCWRLQLLLLRMVLVR